MSRRYISIAEAAEYLKIGDRTVRRLIADGELTGYFIGRGHRMLRVDLDEIDGKLMRSIIGAGHREPTIPPTPGEPPGGAGRPSSSWRIKPPSPPATRTIEEYHHWRLGVAAAI